MATRRAPSWDKSLGLWVAEVYLGVSADGRKLRKRVRSTDYAECVKKLEKLERDLESGDVLRMTPEKISTATWLERWLAAKTSAVNPNTFEDYRSKVHRHLLPRIGNLLLQKLSVLHVETLFEDLERDGVGRRTQQIVHVVLKQSLDKAVRLELLGRSPLDKVQRPKVDRKKQKRKPTWTVEHVRAFLVAASGHDLAAMFVLAVTTGMRQSEILGLLKEHVDLVHDFLRVEWALHEVNVSRQKEVDPRCGPGLALEAPKTDSSRRTIALSRIARDALAAHLGKARAGQLFVFVTADGAPIRARWFRDEWTRLLEGAHVPHLNFKQLRHTCLTLLAEEGVPMKAAQNLAGHSTQALTADVYQQATQRLARQAADAMDRMLGPPSDPKSG